MLIFDLVKSIYFNYFFSFQVKNHIVVHGKDVNGDLLDLMSSQDTTVNILVLNLSNAFNAKEASPDPIIWHCT